MEPIFPSIPKELQTMIFRSVDIDFLHQNVPSMSTVSKAWRAEAVMILNEHSKELTIQIGSLKYEAANITTQINEITELFQEKVNQISIIPSSEAEQKLLCDFYKFNQAIEPIKKMIKEIMELNEKSEAIVKTLENNSQRFDQVYQSHKKISQHRLNAGTLFLKIGKIYESTAHYVSGQTHQ